MSQKPLPPMFSRMESLRFGATPRMLRALLALLFVVLVPTGANMLLKPALLPQAPMPLPVPAQEWTTEARAWAHLPAIMGSLPAPGPNQKRAGKCNPQAAQETIDGGCWVQTKTPPPCPEGLQWEHEKRCWLPVAEAKAVPQAGEVYRVNVAGEE